jgi:hypothetical protein
MAVDMIQPKVAHSLVHGQATYIVFSEIQNLLIASLQYISNGQAH